MVRVRVRVRIRVRVRLPTCRALHMSCVIHVVRYTCRALHMSCVTHVVRYMSVTCRALHVSYMSCVKNIRTGLKSCDTKKIFSVYFLTFNVSFEENRISK